MAKSANSKVIFLPAANSTMPGASAFNASLDKADAGEAGTDKPFGDFGGGDGFQQAINSRVIENI